MQPIPFKGQNVVFGENQPQYLPLPALKLPDGEVITCWSLSDQELEDLQKNKCIYFKQLTFNGPLQPIMPLVNLEDGIELLK